MRTAPRLLKRPSRSSPGSRAKSVPTCQVLRPRRAEQALALSRLSVLPSATLTASAPWTNLKLSRLNGWPAGSPVNASSRISRRATHDSGPVRLAIPLLLWTFTITLCAVSRRTSVLYFPFRQTTPVSAGQIREPNCSRDGLGRRYALPFAEPWVGNCQPIRRFKPSPSSSMKPTGTPRQSSLAILTCGSSNLTAKIDSL